MKTFCSPKKSSRGFTLVEIMVAMVIGLLGVIIIFQVFAVSEGYRRTTTSGGDAVQSGAMALFEVERELRQAGYGINETTLLGCPVRYYDDLNPPGGPPGYFTFVLAPVTITQGAAGAPDTLTVTYSNAELLPTAVKINANMPTPTSDFVVDNSYGFKNGDLVIAAETGKDCTLAQISDLPGGTLNVVHDPVPGNYTYTDPVTGQPVQKAIRYNKAGGLGVSYTTNGQLFTAGNLPTNIIYSVSTATGQLMANNVIVSTAPSPIIDGIVQLKAQYGKDANNDAIVDTWDNVAPITSTDWSQVLAVRLVLVARSSLREKPDPATGVCNTTTAMPTWIASTINPSNPTQTNPITLTDDADGTSWRCYRYKTYETTVPLRNMIWRPL